MGIFEAIVVFLMAWWLMFLPMLSAGTRSQHEAGAVSPGTERGAPVAVRWGWKILIRDRGGGHGDSPGVAGAPYGLARFHG